MRIDPRPPSRPLEPLPAGPPARPTARATPTALDPVVDLSTFAAATKVAPGCGTSDPRELPIGRPALPSPPSASFFRAAYAPVLVDAWCRAHPGETPDPRSLALRLAQAAFETGEGTSMYCFNFGGTKSVPGERFFYASTFEGVGPKKAAAMIAAHPELYSYDRKNNRVDPTGMPIPNGDGKVMVRLARQAKGAKFAGFETASAGARFFLAHTEAMTARALAKVDAGAPPGSMTPASAYASALIEAKYFTGSTAVYGQRLRAEYAGCLEAVERALGTRAAPTPRNDVPSA